MRIKAEFIGQTSCGFVTNGIYNIKIKPKGKWIWVYSSFNGARCPYSSIQKLAENWRMPVDKNEEVGRFSNATMKEMIIDGVTDVEEIQRIKSNIILPDGQSIWMDIPRKREQT